MTTFHLTGPVDDAGRLLHEDDLTAQAALALARLEAALEASGRTPAELGVLRVLTTAPASAGLLLEVLRERLDVTGATPAIEVLPHPLPIPGMQVALEADLGPRTGPW